MKHAYHEQTSSHSNLPLQVLLWRLFLPIPILPHVLLRSRTIRLEPRYLLTIHTLGHLIRLPLLKAKLQSLMTIILIIRLILMIFHANEIAVHSLGVERQGDECGDGCGLGDDLEGPGLFVLELDYFVVRADDFVAFVFGGFEEFGEGEPLAYHFVAVSH